MDGSTEQNMPGKLKPGSTKLDDWLKGRKLDLEVFLINCCKGLDVSYSDVMQNLLSEQDKEDIINGFYTAGVLRDFIKTWVQDGKKKYGENKQKTVDIDV